MSSFVFKIIAIITMLIDHIGLSINNNAFRCIGRIALPIFAWQIAVGADKTKNIKKYAIRLLLFALISQPFYMIYMNYLIGIKDIYLNIGFELFLGLLCIIAFKKNNILGVLITVLTCVISEVLNIEYGFYGICMIVIFYLFKDKKILLFIYQLANLAIYVYITKKYQQAFAIISVVLLLLLHNNKKGKDIKWIFYVFYPLHFVLLFICFKYII